MTTATDQLAILRAMTADQPDRPDHRSHDQVAADMAAEQRAEDRAAAKAGEFDGAGSRDWLAMRRSA